MSCRYLEDYQWLECLVFFNGACAYCGGTKNGVTADHLVPRSQGGADAPENIVPACQSCNEAKADQEWRDFIMSLDNFSQERMNKIFDWRRICKQARVGRRQHGSD